jgi:DNA mismatch endonuclease (patch repair protein)
MADVFDKEARRRIMQRVRTARTEPEECLAVALKTFGLHFRRNDHGVFGVPDFSFRRPRLAVFVDGDFWHGRSWFEAGAAPATNPRFWIAKFERNRERDRLVDLTLRKNGWSVLRLWGSEIRMAPMPSAKKVRARLLRLARRDGTFRV